MKGQLYRVRLDDDAYEFAKPAQFVFPSNPDDTVIGFINEVDRDARELEICLFFPGTLPKGATLMEEKLDEETTTRMLRMAMDKNPEMEEEWQSVLEEADPTLH